MEAHLFHTRTGQRSYNCNSLKHWINKARQNDSDQGITASND